MEKRMITTDVTEEDFPLEGNLRPQTLEEYIGQEKTKKTLMQFVGNLGYVAVTILGGYLAIKKTIEVGQIQSFLQYVRNFSQPITQLAQLGNMMQTTAASAERVFEFLEEEEEIEVEKDAVPVDTLAGNVTFEHVNFGYNKDQTIINDFSVDV